MRLRTRFHSASSTLIVTLSTLSALSLMAALTFTRVAPRFRMSHQNAAWEEARLAAEAGIDVAMGDLLRNSAAPSGGSWQGWQRKDGGSITNETVLGSDGGLVGGLLSTTLGLVTGLLGGLLGGGSTTTTTATPVPSSGIVSTGPIYLDNLRVSSSSGVPTEVDVQLWSLQPGGASTARWFRIRSMATCALPPAARNIPANLDASLRRFSLRKVRPQLKRDDPGRPSSIPLPNISRTVEVIVEPVLPFELAICAARNVTLSPVGSWCVDSYDSRDPLKSAAGLYPGKSSPLVRENGHVATSKTRPASSRYGTLITANGSRVRGYVATQGGDDPHTPAHENVSGDAGLDPARIRDDFCRELNPIPRPPVASPLAPPLFGPFVAGAASAPTFYRVAGNLGDFRVAAASGEPKSTVVIMIDGDLKLSSPFIVPPTVTVILYVRGNIEIHSNANTGPWNSGLPGQLIVIGESDPTVHRTLRAFGSSVIAAAFYGPTYVVSLDGDVDWRGSMTAYDFQVRTGGDGGVHYDEALALVGPPISYRIARYVEDVRE
jgi:hypothetical protein